MVQKKMLGIILNKLMHLEYGNNNIREIENTLKKLELKKVKLPKYVKKKLIDHWVIDKYNDDIMPGYSYVIDPIDDIDIEINAVLDFYNDILDMKTRLDNSIRNMNCKIEISLEDKVVSSFEYGRTGWCIETVNNLYDNLIRKRIDFDNLLND